MPSNTAQPGELREDDDFTTALYRAAIGPVNTNYYLAIFTTWESASHWKPRWNSAAGLWTLGWLAFRKMGGAALAYVGALVGGALLAFGVGRLFFNLSETGLFIMFSLWLLTAVLVPGLWGNVWFHRHCRKRMAVALAAHTEVAESCGALARQSSQPRRAMAVGALQVGLLVALGLGAVQSSALMQQSRIEIVGASPATPQMASGKVKDLPAAQPSTQMSAPAAIPTAPKPASAPVVSPSATTAPVVIKTADSAPAAAAKVATPLLPPPPVKAAARSAPAVVAPTTVAATAPAASGRFGVNVGLFAKAANVQSTQAKLEAAQLPTRVDTLQMQRGPRTRIRVGPFATQAQADEAALKIRALGFEAMTYQN